ncbi:hypothetical protein GALL_527700 [mine drainage metagenome]|uniref:Uncharacterized protein n=1 Tax=mine drainage metagenome TaxID=410659 RepID=A0A1J5PQ25_9ZZZZ
MDQPQLLLRPLWPLSGLFRWFRAFGLWPRRGRTRGRAFKTFRIAHPTRHSRWKLSPSCHQRIGARSRHAAQRAESAFPSRLRSRWQGVTAAFDQSTPRLRNPGDHPRSGTHRTGLHTRSQARRHRGIGTRGGRRSIRSAPPRLRLRHDPEPLGSIAFAGQRAVFLLGKRSRGKSGHAKLYGRQRPRHRRDDRGHAGGAGPPRLCFGGARPGSHTDVRFLRYPAF